MRKAERQLARYKLSTSSKKKRLQAQREKQVQREAANILLSLSKSLERSRGETAAESEPCVSLLECHRHDGQSSHSAPSVERPTASTMTDMTIAALEVECAALRQENIELQQEIQRLKRRENFLESPKKVCYYTGLPSIVRFSLCT